jgi:pyrrolidone-carboxylate peptidase
MKRAWLLTAFEPFAGRPENNSQSVMTEIKKLIDENSKDPAWPFKIFFHTLPTEYDTCHTVLMNEIESLKKQGVNLEGVLSLGEGAEEFKIETQANNLDDVPNFPDNKGVVRVEQKIFPKLKDEVIPMRFPFEAFARIRSSTSPGFYICNHLCARMAREFVSPSLPYFGFIHVPRSGQGGVFTPDVCAAMIVNGMRKITG